MKLLLVSFCLLFLVCQVVPDNLKYKSVNDGGTQKIGDNIYLKQLTIERKGYYNDRVYLLVDSANRLISGVLTTNITIPSGKSHVVESVSIISR